MKSTRSGLPVVLALAIACLAAQAARAADDDVPFGRSGAYLGVGASRSFNVIESFLSGTPILEDIKVSDSWGVNARGGYHVTSWFAVEGEYEWLHPFTFRLRNADIGTLELQSATANIRFILPLARFQPYILLGAGGLFSKTDTPFGRLEVEGSAFAGRLGLGVDAYLTHNLYFNLGLEGVLSPAKIAINTSFGSASTHGLGTLALQFGLGWHF
jgi:opacity protein-like surface antigen